MAQQQGDLADAEAWYKKALAIREALDDRPEMASSYHQLGMVAQDRGDLAVAEDWYKKALAIEEALGNRPGMALTYCAMGLLAEQRDRKGEALDWTIRCVALFPEFPHPSTRPGPYHLGRLTRMWGMATLQESWQRCTGQPLPAHVRAAVERMLSATGSTEG